MRASAWLRSAEPYPRLCFAGSAPISGRYQWGSAAMIALHPRHHGSGDLQPFWTEAALHQASQRSFIELNPGRQPQSASRKVRDRVGGAVIERLSPKRARELWKISEVITWTRPRPSRDRIVHETEDDCTYHRSRSWAEALFTLGVFIESPLIVLEWQPTLGSPLPLSKSGLALTPCNTPAVWLQLATARRCRSARYVRKYPPDGRSVRQNSTTKLLLDKWRAHRPMLHAATTSPWSDSAPFPESSGCRVGSVRETWGIGLIF
jgi:hypothetical protein